MPAAGGRQEEEGSLASKGREASTGERRAESSLGP